MVQREIREYLENVLIPTREERLFWRAFSENIYQPSWIFGEGNESVKIARHPMALWKCRNREEDRKPMKNERVR